MDIKNFNFYSGQIKPGDNVIFVFGSNPEGRHGAGSAKVAWKEFGAKYYVGEGLQGNSYAIPTKDLRVKENDGRKSISPEAIMNSIKKMYITAEYMPDKKFMIAYRNSAYEETRCGYTGLELAKMFVSMPVPKNIWFSDNWKNVIKSI